jgi:hypothetical protein
MTRTFLTAPPYDGSFHTFVVTVVAQELNRKRVMRQENKDS